MKVLEEGREYLVRSMKESDSQFIKFYQRKKDRVKLTEREYHESQAGEKLPNYFFEQIGVEPESSSGRFSDKKIEIELDGTTVDELLKVLISQFKYYQDNVPCEENDKSIEKLIEIQNLQRDRIRNRRIRGTFGSLPPEE